MTKLSINLQMQAYHMEPLQYRINNIDKLQDNGSKL